MPKKLNTISEAQLVKDVAFGTGVSQADTRAVLSALKEEIIDYIIGGNKVNLMGLVRFTPVYVKEKKKGELVRNPGTGEEAPRTKAVPASFKVRANASTALKAKFPSVKSQVGAQLERKLK